MALLSRTLLAIFFLGLIVPICFASGALKTEEESESHSGAEEGPGAVQNPAAAPEEAAAEAGQTVQPGQGALNDHLKYLKSTLEKIPPRAKSMARKVRSVVQKRPAVAGGAAAGTLAFLALCAFLISAATTARRSPDDMEDISARVAHTVKNNKTTALIVGVLIAAAAAAYFSRGYEQQSN